MKLLIGDKGTPPLLFYAKLNKGDYMPTDNSLRRLIDERYINIDSLPKLSNWKETKYLWRFNNKQEQVLGSWHGFWE